MGWLMENTPSGTTPATTAIYCTPVMSEGVTESWITGSGKHMASMFSEAMSGSFTGTPTSQVCAWSGNVEKALNRTTPGRMRGVLDVCGWKGGPLLTDDLQVPRRRSGDQ